MQLDANFGSPHREALAKLREDFEQLNRTQADVLDSLMARNPHRLLGLATALQGITDEMDLILKQVKVTREVMYALLARCGGNDVDGSRH